jgi:hypothetical protein
MISIFNNYLPEQLFNELQRYCNDNEFQIVKAGEKEFSVLEVPQDIIPYLQLAGHSIILTFIRSAYKGFDDTQRHHADNIIEGQKTAMASVLYINQKEGVTPNGTLFLNHILYGSELTEGVSNEVFDDIIENDSMDESCWTENARVYSKPNRLVTYSANQFHGKFPNEIEEGVRQVLVIFYKKD